MTMTTAAHPVDPMVHGYSAHRGSISSGGDAGGLEALLHAVERTTSDAKTHESSKRGSPETAELFLRLPSSPTGKEPHGPDSFEGSRRSKTPEPKEASGSDNGDFEDTVTARRGSKRIELTLALLAQHFHEPLDVVTDKLGVSKTTLKAVCRRLGLAKWPYRRPASRKRSAEFDATSPDGAGALRAIFHDGLAAGAEDAPAAKRPRFEGADAGAVAAGALRVDAIAGAIARARTRAALAPAGPTVAPPLPSVAPPTAPPVVAPAFLLQAEWEFLAALSARSAWGSRAGSLAGERACAVRTHVHDCGGQ
jgi:hypothetical protein